MVPDSLLDLRERSLKTYAHALPSGTTPDLPGRYHIPEYTVCHDHRPRPCADQREYALAAARPGASPPARSDQRVGAPARRSDTRTTSCSLPTQVRVYARDRVPG